MATDRLSSKFDELEAAVAALCNNNSCSGALARRQIGKLKKLIPELKRQCGTFTQQDQELARLASIVSCSEDAILGKDLNGIIQSWNAAARKLFGYSRREMIGHSIRKLIPKERLKEEEMILERLRRGRAIKHYQTVRRRKDGTLVDVSISISPIRDHSGKICGAAKIIRDISEQMATEAALRDREQRMAAIVQTAVDAIITIDQRGIIESCNPATQRLFGYRSAELVGRNVSMLMPEPFQSEHNGYLRVYLTTGRARIIGIGREVAGMRKDGTTFPMSLSVSEVRSGDRHLFTGMIHDLTGRRQLESQILEASAEEQRRIGQDLHDGLCQDLIGIAFSADMAARQLAGRGAPEVEMVERLAASIRQAAGQARRLSHGLNPVDVNVGGLPVALESLAVRTVESFRVNCTFEWDEVAQVQDDSAAGHLYRISQEAVGNAIRHGKARSVRIALQQKANGTTTLSVTDDGIGLPPALISSRQPAQGIGLRGMQYRANLMGATFDIAPAPTGGTVVTVTLPERQSKLKANGTKRASGRRDHVCKAAHRFVRP